MGKRNLVRNLDALDAPEPYDVCIIGSGPAGTILGTQLVKAGQRVVMLESGNSLVDWLTDPRLKQLAEYQFSGDTDYPLTRTSARLVGGNSNFWTGRSDRFQPSDFEDHPYTPPNSPWPISYDDLEPYYERAEHTFRVRGGPFSEHMPPRKNPLPLPPSPDITSLKELMKPAGVVVDDSPTATPTKAFRFFKVNKEILPEYLASPNATLVSGVVITRLQHEPDGTVTGALCKTFDGVEKIARAKRYVLACGGIQNPRILLLSRSEAFPNGLGNSHDRVGRGFNEHPAVNIYTKIRHNRYTIFPKHKIGRTQQYYERFRAQGLGSVVPVIIQSYLFPHHLVDYKPVDIPKHFFKILSRTVKATLYMGCLIEQRIQDSNRVTLSGERNDVFGDPIAHLQYSYHPDDLKLLQCAREMLHGIFDKLNATDRKEIQVTFSRHHQGTCRMGDNPATSVVDRNLKLHDSPNLYIPGVETIVTGAAVPPTLTLAALTHRLGDHLIELHQEARKPVEIAASAAV